MNQYVDRDRRFYFKWPCERCREMAEPKVLACVPWLKGTAANVMSQFGEDGLIRTVFDRQAPTTP